MVTKCTLRLYLLYLVENLSTGQKEDDQFFKSHLFNSYFICHLMSSPAQAVQQEPHLSSSLF